MTTARIDGVRASRDGHQFHEAWLGRRALGLLLPRDTLCAIAVEGLSEEDEEGATAAMIEVADATFYFGEGASFETCARLEVAQFKYSIASDIKEFRVADVKKTISKFAETEIAFVAKHGPALTLAKVRYVLVTNRPLWPHFAEALKALGAGLVPESSEAKVQRDQFCNAIALQGDQLASFAARIDIAARADSLSTIEKANAAIISDWSATDDVLARARLGDLRDLVRKKAGSAGQANKLIKRVDILAVLGLAEESDLLPTPQAFPNVGEIIEREQLRSFMAQLVSAPRWIVHATGGVGKTVFAQSLAKELGKADEVALFDCFGGGAYRSFTDGRHRLERGLLHLINDLACRGLCDPILPGSSDPAEILRRSLQRLKQSIDTLRRTRPAGRLILVLDAADNAATEADFRKQPSFPRELLETLTVGPPIEGLVVIATARTERCHLAIGRAECKPFCLEPFSFAETKAFVAARRPDATGIQIEVIYRRSEGNPRIIDNLIDPNRPLLDKFRPTDVLDVTTLIKEKIDSAVGAAAQKGADQQSVAAFLCALSALPPPIPAAEVSIAFGISLSEVESFVADLFPLLDRTRHGIIFKDEPTETLVKQEYGSRLDLLNGVVDRLLVAQSSSPYAARALPGLLLAMGRVKDLHDLAFDVRFPASFTSDVAKRTIRLNRLRTALAAAAQAKNYSASVDLLVELAAISAVDERGENYLLSHPDLVVILGDADALRRLFDARREWPGRRHARLAIAYSVDGDTPEALPHAKRADEWQRWLYGQDEKTRIEYRVDIDDRLAVPFYLLARGNSTSAALDIARWNDTYGYLLASRLFELCKVSANHKNTVGLASIVRKLASCRTASSPIIASALTALPHIEPAASMRLLRRLATSLSDGKKLEVGHFERREADSLRLGLHRAAMRAAHLGLGAEALKILSYIGTRHYDFWALRDPFSSQYILPWLLGAATAAVAGNNEPTLFDCIPVEFTALVAGEIRPSSLEEQQELLERKLAEKPTPPTATDNKDRSTLSESDRSRAKERLRSRVLPLLTLTRELAKLIRAADADTQEVAISSFFAARLSALAEDRDVNYPEEQKRFIESLYREAALNVFPALGLLTPSVASHIATWMQEAPNGSPWPCIEFVEYFSAAEQTHSQAGLIAVQAVKRIEGEDDVQRRADLFAQLARALLPANRSEAASLFSRGLSELDAIGSGDFAFTNELLCFAVKLSPQHPLPPATALRLAKICELNNYDSHKFPWPLSGRAFSRAWGHAYLAQLARWHDRDKAELEISLAPALSFLLADRRIRPEDAVSLLNLVAPIELWDWGWEHLIESLVSAKPDNLVPLLNELFDQFEHAYPEGAPASTLRDIRIVLERYSSALAAVAQRITRLESRAASSTRGSNTGAQSESEVVLDDDQRNVIDPQKEIDQATDATDPVSAESIENLVDKLDEINRALDAKSLAFKELRERVKYADQTKHIETIVAARNLPVFAKIQLLKDTKQQWLTGSPTALAVLKNIGVRLVRQQASELLDRDWGFRSDLTGLADISGDSQEDIALELIKASTTSDLNVAGTTWLSLACILAPRATANVPTTALQRLLDSGAARLADDVGDGPWRPQLDPGKDRVDVAAGLVWFCLGSPEATQRWRAAHTVRTLARLGRWPVIDKLVARLNIDGAGPFQDQSLPFFSFHARQWLLIAIARLAIDYPKKIARHAQALEAIALDETFPHVGLRETARRALLACLPTPRTAAARKRLKRLRQLHVSKFPYNSEGTDYAATHAKRPADIPEPEPTFHFDYDFSKYELTRLAGLFGLPRWQVDDQCVRWIRTWHPSVSSMYDFAGRPHPSGSYGYYQGTNDSYHAFGTYVARHATAVTSGELFLRGPVFGTDDAERPWKEWLDKFSLTRADGLWLSDGTGSYPSYALHNLLVDAAKDKPKTPSCDVKLLCSLAGINKDRQITDRLTVNADWTSPDRVSVSIGSALVPRAAAGLAAAAMATAPMFDMWLPFLEEHEEDGRPRYKPDMSPCEPWITVRDARIGIDERDPYGSRTAATRPRPSKHFFEQFKLACSDPWLERWLDDKGRLALQAEAWGCRMGTGEREEWDAGTALLCDPRFLSKALKALDRTLILLVKLQYYHERDRYDDRATGGGFSHAFLVAAIDSSLKITIPKPSSKQRAAVNKIGDREKHDFRKRFAALKSLSLRRHKK